MKTGDLTMESAADQAAQGMFGELPLGVTYERRKRPRRRETDVLDRLGVAESAPQGAAARRDAIFRRLLALGDVVAGTVAVAGTGLLVAPDYAAVASLVALPLLVLAVKVVGLYDRDELVVHKTTLNDAPHLFYLTAVITVLLSVLESAVNGVDASASTLLVLWGFLLSGMIVARWTRAASRVPSRRRSAACSSATSRTRRAYGGCSPATRR